MAPLSKTQVTRHKHTHTDNRTELSIAAKKQPTYLYNYFKQLIIMIFWDNMTLSTSWGTTTHVKPKNMVILNASLKKTNI